MYPNRSHLQTVDTVSLIDTHCHLDCEPLRSRLARILASACRAGVNVFVVPGVHPANWQRMADIAGVHAGVYCAFGIHPMHADLVDNATLTSLKKIACSGVAIGEIGLDPAYTVPLVIQEQAFREQLRLSVLLGLPVLIHCRRAFQQTLRILQEEQAGQVGGIMHAFSGSPEMAREFIRLGFAISLSGAVTWERAVRPVRLAREIPLESLVLETDAPDMPPQAMRGKANEPAWLIETLRTVAEIRGVSAVEVALAARNNSRRILAKIL